MTEREALKLALEALEWVDTYSEPHRNTHKAITAIKEALAQPEPVAWPCVIAEADFLENTITLTMQCTDYKVSAGKHWLSTTPPQRSWVGLTDEQVKKLRYQAIEEDSGYTPLIKATEAKLRSKNT